MIPLDEIEKIVRVTMDFYVSYEGILSWEEPGSEFELDRAFMHGKLIRVAGHGISFISEVNIEDKKQEPFKRLKKEGVEETFSFDFRNDKHFDEIHRRLIDTMGKVYREAKRIPFTNLLYPSYLRIEFNVGDYVNYWIRGVLLFNLTLQETELRAIFPSLPDEKWLELYKRVISKVLWMLNDIRMKYESEKLKCLKEVTR